GDRAARRVDVEVHVPLTVLALEVQELGHDQVRDRVVQGHAEEDDALLEQARIDVERALSPASLLDDDRDEIVGDWLHRRYSLKVPGSFEVLRTLQRPRAGSVGLTDPVPPPRPLVRP